MAHVGEDPGTDLMRLPLHDEHHRLGARMTGFAGWSMPLSYGSIVEEHLAVRTRAGLFDISHMGAFIVRGHGAFRSVQALIPTDIADLDVGRATYTMLLNPEGGIIDDLIVYHRGDGYLLIVNAATTDRDRDWIDEHLDVDAEMDDLSELTCLFALQGPQALEIMRGLSEDPIDRLPAFSFLRTEVAEIEATVMRTGYTGETGVEVLVDTAEALELWHSLLGEGERHGAVPAGIGARDTLRLEAGLLLSGQDMDETTTPYEAGLGWRVDIKEHDFVGRESLVQIVDRQPERRLVGLRSESGALPRTGTPILAGNEPVGRVTSGTQSPVLGHPIALGYVPPDYAEPGTAVAFDVRGRRIEATVVKKPFYKRGVTPLPGPTGR